MKLVDLIEQVFDSDYVKSVLNSDGKELVESVLFNINDILEREALLDNLSKEFIQILLMTIIAYPNVGPTLIAAYELGAEDYQWQEFVGENYLGGEL